MIREFLTSESSIHLGMCYNGTVTVGSGFHSARFYSILHFSLRYSVAVQPILDFPLCNVYFGGVDCNRFCICQGHC